MHEMAIARSVAEIASAHAEHDRVVRIEVRVGHLRQVVPSALEFAFEVLVRGTALDGAELVIVPVAAVAGCRRCGAETALEAFPLICGSCGQRDLEMIRGEELLVEAIEVEKAAG